MTKLQPSGTLSTDAALLASDALCISAAQNDVALDGSPAAVGFAGRDGGSGRDLLRELSPISEPYITVTRSIGTRFYGTAFASRGQVRKWSTP